MLVRVIPGITVTDPRFIHSSATKSLEGIIPPESKRAPLARSWQPRPFRATVNLPINEVCDLLICLAELASGQERILLQGL